MNPQVEFEVKAQSNYWFTYKGANVAAVVFLLIAASNGHHGFAMLGIIGVIGFNAWRVPILQDQFRERMKYVNFKTEVQNLYVTTEKFGQPDHVVVATFKATVEYLKEVGNTHEVRVHLMMFQDVQIFTWWWDANGNLKKTNKAREKMSSAQTWEDYLKAVDLFKKEDREEWLRRVRKDAAGFEWVNTNVFSQWQME